MLPRGPFTETRTGQRTTGVRFRRASERQHGRRLPSGRESEETRQGNAETRNYPPDCGSIGKQTGKARHMLPRGLFTETRTGQRTTGVRFRRASERQHGRRLPSGSESEETRQGNAETRNYPPDCGSIGKQTGKARHMLPRGPFTETRTGQRTTGVRFRRASERQHGRRLPSGRESEETRRGNAETRNYLLDCG